MATYSVFTSQTPANGNADNGAPVTTATTIRISASGQITAGRFYAPATISGTWRYLLWKMTGPAAFTLVADVTLGSAPTPSAWNTVAITPVAVSSGDIFRTAIFNSANRFVVTNGFFASSSSGVTNGPLYAFYDTEPVTEWSGSTVRQGTYAEPGASDPSTVPPTSTFGSGWYGGPDVVFVDTVGGPVTHSGDAALAVTATLTAGAAKTQLPAAALAATATLTAAALRTAAPGTALAATATLTAGAAATKPVTAALAVTATLTAEATTGAAPQTAAAALAVTATLSTAATRTQPAASALAVTATLAAASQRSAVAGAPLAVTATITAGSTLTRTTGTALAVLATLTAAADASGRITYRPNTGTTTRPYAGITTRP